MPHEGDPYLSLLGIRQGPRPPDHYALLGLERFTFEPPVIAEAADVQESKLKRSIAGEHGEVAKRLLTEVAAARAVLLNAARRAAYDATLRSAGADATAALHHTQEIPRPNLSRHGASAARSTALAARRRRSSVAGLSAVAASLAVLAGAVVFAYRDRIFVDAGRAASPAAEMIVRSEPTAPAYDVSPTGERRRYLDFTDDAPSVAPPASNVKQPSSVKEQPSKRSNPKTAAEPRRTPPPAPKSRGKGKATETSTAADVAALTGVAARATASEQAHVTRAVRAAIAAARQRDLPRALAQADLAALTATAADTMREADRVRTAVALLDEFWQAVQQSMAMLTPDATLDRSGRQLTVAEVGEESFSVRDGARTTTYSFKNLPADLAVALAEQPATRGGERAMLLTAAFHALDARGDRDEARRLAGALGAPVAHEATAILELIQP